MQQSIQKCAGGRLFKFFRRQIVALSQPDILNLADDLELEIKQIKDQRYRLGWYMRGSFSYHDLMYKISREDLDILNNIVKDNIDTVEKTRLPLL